MIELKREFSGGDNEKMKVVELKKVKQRSRIIKEFVQEFRRIVRGSIYKRRLLIEKFKKDINDVIKHKLMEAERSPRNIEQ